MYLIDTNIFLEGLLEQEKAESVRYFFQAVDIEKTFMTDLALHSIGIILFRLKKYELFTSFVEDMIINGMEILSSTPEGKAVHSLGNPLCSPSPLAISSTL